MYALIIAALLALTSSAAGAADFAIASGNYGDSKNYYPTYGEKPQYRIVMDGTKLQVTDNTNELTYEIDIANSGEQVLQPKLLEHLRTLPGARTIATLIDHITVSDLNEDASGAVHGNFNIYIASSSVFGSVKAKLTIGGLIKAATCEITRHDGYEQSGNTYQEKKLVYQGSCINAEVGTSFGLKSLEATNVAGAKAFAPEIVNAIGLTADMIFKFYSPVMTGLITVYERR